MFLCILRIATIDVGAPKIGFLTGFTIRARSGDDDGAAECFEAW